LVISSNFYKSSWDDTLLITLLLFTIRALAKLINTSPSHLGHTNIKYQFRPRSRKKIWLFSLYSRRLLEKIIQ
jgi:hypothetical protein